LGFTSVIATLEKKENKDAQSVHKRICQCLNEQKHIMLSIVVQLAVCLNGSLVPVYS